MKNKDNTQLSLFEQIEEPTLEQKEKYQYLFLVSPSYEIKEKIKKVKERLKEVVPEASLALRSTPHISLIGFQTSKKLNSIVFNKLDMAFHKTSRFIVSFNGFENFLHGQISNTLYISIEAEKPLVQLNHILMKVFGLNKRNFKPHMTVAKTLPRESLSKINSFIEEETFQAKFMCTNITVLESIVINKKMSAYKVCKTIELRDSKYNSPLSKPLE